MEQENGGKTMRHTLTLEGRARARVTGGSAVSCFNEREVVLETSEGEVALLGRELNIGQLDLADGVLGVTGEIEGVEYNGPPSGKSKKGLIGRKRK